MNLKSAEVILVTKVGNSYTAVYQNEEETKRESAITAQQIFDYAKRKFSKKNDI